MKKIVFVSLTACLIVAVTSRMSTLAQPSANCIQEYNDGMKEYEKANYSQAKRHFKKALRLSDETDLKQNLIRGKTILMIVSAENNFKDSFMLEFYLSDAFSILQTLTKDELKDPELVDISKTLVGRLKESKCPKAFYADTSRYSGKCYNEKDLIETEKKHEISVKRSKYKKDLENTLAQLSLKYKIEKPTSLEIKVSKTGKISSLRVIEFGHLVNPDLLKAIREIQLPCPDQNFFGITDTTRNDLCFYMKIPPSKDD